MLVYLKSPKLFHFRHLGHQFGGLSSRGLGEVRGLADQVQHTGHGAGADQVGNDDHGQEQGQAGLGADQEFFVFRQLSTSHDSGDGKHRKHSKDNQVGFDHAKYVHDIIHVDSKHTDFLLLFIARAGRAPVFSERMIAYFIVPSTTSA